MRKPNFPEKQAKTGSAMRPPSEKQEKKNKKNLVRISHVQAGARRFCFVQMQSIALHYITHSLLKIDQHTVYKIQYL